MLSDSLSGSRKLQPSVASFVAGNCAVATELRRLSDVFHAGAFEAAIFYAARLLEAITAEALQDVGLPSTGILLTNLETLQQFDLTSPASRTWAHALRRLGNDVRHLLRPVSRTDAELAMVFAERWLVWFFCFFPCGQRLTALTLDGNCLFEATGASLRQFADRCDRAEFDACALAVEMLADAESSMRWSPAPAAVVIERLVDRQHHALAQQLLDASGKWFPEDARLCQLQGLVWSRAGRLEDAMRILEPLNLRLPHDMETTGILAGVYKRQSAAAADPTHWLRMSCQAYERGWRSSHCSSAYLGINAAATLLWIDRRDDSQALAVQVRDLLRSRVQRLSAVLPDAVTRMGYWDRVTLAESEMLVGEFDAARNEYLAAFAAFPHERDSIALSTAQANKTLAKLGASERIAGFWDASKNTGK